MLWHLSVFAAAALSMGAAILPEQFGQFRRESVAPVAADPSPVWNEFGLEESEQATYSGGLKVTAWRFKDPTGAYAARQWMGALHIPAHNYLLRFDGPRPDAATMQGLTSALPKVVRSSAPPLYLPEKGRLAGTERYLLGPAGLAGVEPRIAAELAAFDRGAEAQVAKYRAGGKEVQLTVLTYPTPQMAIDRARAFGSMAGAVVRRAGPVLSVIPEAAGQPAAEALASSVAYRPSFTWNEFVSKDTPQDAAKMILAISMLAGGLIVLSLVLGLFFGGSRLLARRFGMATADEGFTSLHLER